ncbi:hypothetical protein ONS95_007191 [Cadophora gregata]|uniref:uncharacterized protein n=1 Tax=Cadophora gregata TaxID=51156 RepID=UPI0026DDBE34|nr:uncharacterized protein ONS95_007191 [Cadophora gregata]KAK0100741.1 hypothetical protein ONS95_007191 [Cadophora gregata]KAK0117264.1 hypothetical protein ONS96_013097 [Cadophora gregata f. sp. sojae]
MTAFPAWMGGLPYRSASGASPSSGSKSTIIVHINESAAASSCSILRRRSPHSSFGYFEKINAQNITHFNLDYGRPTPCSIHSHNRIHDGPKSQPNPATPMARVAKFFHMEWQYIARGRLTQSRIAAFCSGPVLVIGAVILLDFFLEFRARRRRDTQVATEKDEEDWGTGL